MNEQPGTTRVADRSDPDIRQRRLEALQRAHRAMRVIEHENEVAARYGRSPGGAVDPNTAKAEERAPADDPGGTAEGRTIDRTYAADVDRLVAIHHDLQRERRAARRPLHRHADRLVLALELAERLALERLGFDDYADFESRGGDRRPPRDVIDLEHLDRAERELAAAQATLRELDRLDGGGDDPAPSSRLLAAAIDPPLPDRRSARTSRPTTARRSLFARDGDGQRGDQPGATRDLARPDVTPAEAAWAAAPPLPVRPTDRSRRPQDDDLELLGELTRDGRTFRVEKVPGIAYVDDDETGSALKPDSISYGDPRRLI